MGLAEVPHIDLVVCGTDDVIRCRRARRPRGIVASHLDRDTAAAIPVPAGRV